MQTLRFESQEAWLAGRLGKVTGTRLKDLVVKRGTSEKKGFYEIIAERIAIPRDDESPMDRGHRLESVALERLSQELGGVQIDGSLVIWVRDDNPSMAISPDGIIDREQAVEVKCLNSAAHIEALLTKQIPDEYVYQTRQYFIVNDDLEKLHFVMYDDRMPPARQFIHFIITRDEIAEEIEELAQIEREKLERIDAIVNQLTF